MDVQVLCCFDGKLIDDGNSCKYIGGCKKLLDMVPKTIGYTCFKEKIQQMMKSPSNEIDFKIKCGVRFDEVSLIAIDVDDDESLERVMNTYKEIRAYVIKELTHTPTFVPTQRDENLLPSAVNNHSDEEIIRPEHVDRHKDATGVDNNLGVEIDRQGYIHESVNPSHIDHRENTILPNAQQEGVNISTGNHDGNLVDETMISAMFMEEEGLRLPNANFRFQPVTSNYTHEMRMNPSHMGNATLSSAQQERVDITTGNHDGNLQVDEMDLSGNMQENVLTSHLKEGLPPSSVEINLQTSTCSMANNLHSVPSGLNDIEIVVGSEFVDIDAIRNALCDLAIRTGRKFKPERATKSVLKMKCRDKDCKWRIQATRIRKLPTFKVVKYQNLHTCSIHQRKGDDQDHCQANKKWTVSKILPIIEKNPDIGPRDIVNEIENKFRVRISYNKAAKAKVKALEELHKRSYALLPVLMKEMEGNGYVTKLGRNKDETFRYFFWAFPACVNALLDHLRPFIYIYTIPMKLGVMMFACGIDGYNFGLGLGLDFGLGLGFGISFGFSFACSFAYGTAIHVAFAIFGDDEEQVRWELFLDCLKDNILPAANHNSFTIVLQDFSTTAARAIQKILPSINYVFNKVSVEKAFFQKFKDHDDLERLIWEAALERTTCKDALENFFWEATRALERTTCKDALEKIKEINEDAYNWLEEIGRPHWAAAFYRNNNRSAIVPYPDIDGTHPNLAKIIDGPIVKVVKGSRDMVAEYFSHRQEFGANMATVLIPNIWDHLERVKLMGWTVALIDENKLKYLVDGKEEVDLEEKICSCWKENFGVRGYPCRHALAVIAHEELDASKYFKHWYTTETYRATYSGNLPPIADISQSQSADTELRAVLPPKTKTKRRVGRPPKLKL